MSANNVNLPGGTVHYQLVLEHFRLLAVYRKETNARTSTVKKWHWSKLFSVVSKESGRFCLFDVILFYW
jgi:hypothetical protein